MRRVTPKPRIQVAANSQELSRLAAEEFVQLARKAEREKGWFTVALSGGSTPKTLYSMLADHKEPYRAQLPWKNIHFFWTDERHVPPDHFDSNYRMVNETMLSKVPASTENVHRIKTEIGDANKVASDYEETLRKFFQLREGELPRFDLVLLGLGSDGHTASIFPKSEVIKEADRLVVAPWIEKLKSHRITLTAPVLTNAATAIFLVSGVDKAEALRSVLESDYDPESLPAQLIRPASGEITWLIDKDAASKLRN
jgi:6-phosphogluconolactonase